MHNILVLSLAVALSGCANVCVLIATPAGATCWSGTAPVVRPVPHVVLDAGCSTDSECQAQCVEELRPDEDPAVCAVSLEPVQ